MLHELLAAVESLTNLHYLMEVSTKDPEAIRAFLSMSEPVLETLKRIALQMFSKLD